MEKRAFVKAYSDSILQQRAAVFVGAGLSMNAGYPSWKKLLVSIAEELGIDIESEHDLIGVAQWYINHKGKQRTQIAKVIRDSFPSIAIPPEPYRILARLPLRHVWTTNYDKLPERAWELQRKLLDVKSRPSDFAAPDIRAPTTLYKMHGTVDHPTDVIIAKDDYELYLRNYAAFHHLLAGHLLSLQFLFVGFSFADPNINQLFAIVRNAMNDHSLVHYAIVKQPSKPASSSKKSLEKHAFECARHKHWVHDLTSRYGIEVIEINDYSEVESLLSEIEKRISRASIFVSGSHPGPSFIGFDRTSEVSTEVGQMLVKKKLRIVSGFGLTVGSCVLSSALEELYKFPCPNLDEFVFLRPFPQVIPTGFTADDFYQRYREDLISQAGVCVFIGGLKIVSGAPVTAKGVIREYEIAKLAGKLCIPVGSTGGAALEIWDRMNIDGAIPFKRSLFKKLNDPKLTPIEICKTIEEILESL
jgi:hypothetical protein